MNYSKVEENKQIKRDKLLSSAYTLFIKKGLHETTINDITNYADVAKGTFYLYFKDKWDIYHYVVIEKTRLLFDEAIIYSDNSNFENKIISITDYIINSLENNKELMILIGNNLSLGLYNNKYNNEEYATKEMLINDLKVFNKRIKNPDIVLYMIIELIGSTCYNSIINGIPLEIKDYKEYLYNQIRKMIK